MHDEVAGYGMVLGDWMDAFVTSLRLQSSGSRIRCCSEGAYAMHVIVTASHAYHPDEILFCAAARDSSDMGPITDTPRLNGFNPCSLGHLRHHSMRGDRARLPEIVSHTNHGL